MLRIENISVSYGSHQVMRRVSLCVQSGEVVALIGPNGAGKSTLIRAISGVIPLQGGFIRTNGENLAALSPMPRARFLAVVPQAVSLPPAFTVWETVLLGRTPHLNFLGQISRNDEQIARAALIKVDALNLSERRVGELSGGEQQRVLLARALAQSTPILLLDEPTTHLDLQYQVSLMETIQQLARQENLAILIALHDLNLAARYANRVVLLFDGKVRANGRPAQVMTPHLIAAAYGVKVSVIPHPFTDGLLVIPETTPVLQTNPSRGVRRHRS